MKCLYLFTNLMRHIGPHLPNLCRNMGRSKSRKRLKWFMKILYMANPSVWFSGLKTIDITCSTLEYYFLRLCSLKSNVQRRNPRQKWTFFELEVVSFEPEVEAGQGAVWKHKNSLEKRCLKNVDSGGISTSVDEQTCQSPDTVIYCARTVKTTLCSKNVYFRIKVQDCL